MLIKIRNKVTWFFILLIIILVIMIGLFIHHIFSNHKQANTETTVIDGVSLSYDAEKVKIFSEDIDIANGDVWRNYKDIVKVKADVEKQMNGFIKALKDKDPKKSASFFAETERSKYEELFANNTENLDAIAELFQNKELIFLSPEVDKSQETLQRIAEFSIQLSGESYSIIFINENGKWLIQSL